MDGEEKIIELAKKTFVPENRDVIVGPGDDTAVLSSGPGEYLLMTTDSLVENVHFKTGQATLFQIGRKAAAVNLSDIAAMGGLPLYALVSVGMPERYVKKMYLLLKGLQSMAKLYAFDIVGGNMSRAPFIFIDVSMTGRVEKNFLKLRSGAKNGDRIFVTGTLGGTILGKHLNFKPRIKEAREIISEFPVNSMMDISDGLSSDLVRLARSSRKGFLINLESIPVSKDAFTLAGSQRGALKSALNDGEDYELLFTVDSSFKGELPERISGMKVTGIGKITGDKKYRGRLNHRVMDIKPSGFSHF